MGERHFYTSGAESRALIASYQPQMGLLRDLMEKLRDDLCISFSDVTDYDREIAEIEVDHVSGFIPTTNGGFSLCVCADMDTAYGSGSVPKAIQPYLDSSLKDAEAEWLRAEADEFGYDPDKDYGEGEGSRLWAFLNWLEEQEAPPDGQDTLPGAFPRHGSPRSERARESYYETQDCWLREGGTYFYMARAILYGTSSTHNETGEDEVLVCVGINTDFEYGRDKGTQWLAERTIPLRLVTEELMEEVYGQMFDGLSKA